MIKDLGEVRPGQTIYVPFHTFDSNDPSASVTITGLATTDIEIYKDGSTTQRASDAGYTLLDTDGIDFDTTTGIHGVSIDLADNTTAGFYAAGSQYMVVIASITVDAATVNFIPVTFTIGYPSALLNTTIATLSSQTSFTLTDGPAEDDALNGMYCIIHDVASQVQMGTAIISDYTGSTKTVTLESGTTFTAAATDNFALMGMAPLQPTTAGNKLDVTSTGAAGIDWGNVENPTTTLDLSATSINLCDTTTDVTNQVSADVTAVSGDTAAANNLESDYDGTGYNKSNSTIGTCTTNTDMITAAAVNAEVDTALADIHLDHLLAVDYDPASPPGTSTALLNEIIESDAGVSRFTANALEQAPTGGSAPTAAAIADAVWDEATAGHTTAGTFGEQVSTDLDAILVDTNSLNDTKIPDTISLANINAQCDTAISDAALATAANLATVDSNVDAILVDTNELQADWTNGGRLDLLLDAIKAVTDNIPSAGALNDISAADVNAQVLDVLNTDTFAELSSIPAAATTLTNMIRMIYLMSTNEIRETSTTQTLRNRADSTTIGTSTVTDDGTTSTRGSFS